MKLICGLGNPGKKYENTRHNMGFMAVDLISDLSQIDVDKEVFNGLLGRGKILNEDVLLFKPTTFMNLSGTAIQQVVHFYKIDIDDIIVIYDDMALEPGKIRLRESGSAGGHNGMKNIIENLGTDKFKRIRVGIGEPGGNDNIDYVLSKPLKEEQPLIDEALQNVANAIREAYKSTFAKAMSLYN